MTGKSLRLRLGNGTERGEKVNERELSDEHPSEKAVGRERSAEREAPEQKQNRKRTSHKYV